MTTEFAPAARSLLPAPYGEASFHLHRQGIFDDAGTAVFIDSERSFAVLHPRPILDYAHYVPRQKKLDLTAYKAKQDVLSRRFAKTADLFPATGTVLEVGAAEGGFIARLLQERPALECIAVEPDQNTSAMRAELPLRGDFPDLGAAHVAGCKADIVCLFHVFEHVTEPKSFIEALRAVLAPRGRIIIEVPSLDDPLLTLYGCGAYEAFYFQRQHPYVYSRRSLERVLTANGLRIVESRPYQRYGLENHLAWLTHGKPGGDERFAAMFSSLEPVYRAALERQGRTDTIFVVAENAGDLS